jgi:uncharacterized protein
MRPLESVAPFHKRGKRSEMDGCILLFVKFPGEGDVKTRLSKESVPGFVETLYRNFVLDLLETLKTGKWPIIINYHPPESGNAISKWLGENYLYAPQNGSDLGERMKNAFKEAFAAGFSKAVIIGSDMPDLELSVLSEAFSALDSDDAVLGPAMDGGYYLIGFRQTCFLPKAFESISWGTDSVFRDTVKILEKRRCSVNMLPDLRDVDTIDDLRALFYRNRNSAFAESRTMKYISDSLKKGIPLWKNRAGD